MKIIFISVGDNGGGCYWLAEAINKYTQHKARSIRYVQSWINYPYDIFCPSSSDFEQWVKWADVVHIRDNVSDKWPIIPHKKPVVVTWTGMSYRKAAVKKLQNCANRGWVNTVSTPDLITYATGDVKPIWLPNPREEMITTKKHKGFSVCHAPTFRERKGTDLVGEACKKAGLPLSIIENTTYIDALKEKAKCSMVIDQIGEHSFGYGNNAIEAWAMCKPAISDFSKGKFGQYTIDEFGQSPYARPGDDLAETIESFKDESVYNYWLEIGREYFFKYHHSQVVAERLVEIYRGIL